MVGVKLRQNTVNYAEPQKALNGGRGEASTRVTPVELKCGGVMMWITTLSRILRVEDT